MEKHSVSRLSYLFAHLYLLSSYSFSSDLLSSNLPLLSASALLCFSSVHIVGSLTSKLPSIMHICIISVHNTKHTLFIILCRCIGYYIYIYRVLFLFIIKTKHKCINIYIYIYNEYGTIYINYPNPDSLPTRIRSLSNQLHRIGHLTAQTLVTLSRC